MLLPALPAPWEIGSSTRPCSCPISGCLSTMCTRTRSRGVSFAYLSRSSLRASLSMYPRTVPFPTFHPRLLARRPESCHGCILFWEERWLTPGYHREVSELDDWSELLAQEPEFATDLLKHVVIRL